MTLLHYSARTSNASLLQTTTMTTRSNRLQITTRTLLPLPRSNKVNPRLLLKRRAKARAKARRSNKTRATTTRKRTRTMMLDLLKGRELSGKR